MKTFYSERIVGWWVGILLGAVAATVAGTAGGAGPWPWIAVALALTLAVLLGTMTITVDREAVRLRATLGWPRVTVRLAEIDRVEVVTGLLWKTGYGIDWKPGRVRWNLAGNRGVVLYRRRGAAVWIGTPAPDRLRNAIDRARARAGLAGES